MKYVFCFGKRFRQTATCLVLDEILSNPITRKNVANKGLYLNRNAKIRRFIANQ